MRRPRRAARLALLLLALGGCVAAVVPGGGTTDAQLSLGEQGAAADAAAAAAAAQPAAAVAPVVTADAQAAPVAPVAEATVADPATVAADPAAAVADATTPEPAPGATATAAPSPSPADAEARARELLAKANAVLALRKAGLLPGTGALPAAQLAKTVDAVNAAAPEFDAGGGVLFRPSLTQSLGGGGAAAAAAPARSPAPAPPTTEGRWAGADAWERAPVGAMTEYVRNRPGAVGGAGAPLAPATAPRSDVPASFAASNRLTSATANGSVSSNALIGELGPLRDGESTGSIVQLIAGFRLSTPFFGTGFNFCVDRYWGSLPKVGIVVPNAAAWLVPDLQDLFGPELNATVALPAPGRGLPAGARAEPTSDGLVVWLPSVQPLYLSNLGFRYGIQIAQLAGIDFGVGARGGGREGRTGARAPPRAVAHALPSPMSLRTLENRVPRRLCARLTREGERGRLLARFSEGRGVGGRGTGGPALCLQFAHETGDETWWWRWWRPPLSRGPRRPRAARCAAAALSRAPRTPWRRAPTPRAPTRCVQLGRGGARRRGSAARAARAHMAILHAAPPASAPLRPRPHPYALRGLQQGFAVRRPRRHPGPRPLPPLPSPPPCGATRRAPPWRCSPCWRAQPGGR